MSANVRQSNILLNGSIGLPAAFVGLYSTFSGQSVEIGNKDDDDGDDDYGGLYDVKRT